MQLFPQSSSLFIKKKKKKHIHHTRPPAPVTYGTRTHIDTEEPGDSRISTTISLFCRKTCPRCQKALHTIYIQRPSTRTPLKQRHMLVLSRTCTPHSHTLYFPSVALEPSCLIKSISCASAVARQMTFKQVLLFGSEQMSGVCLEKPQFGLEQSCESYVGAWTRGT